MKENTPARGAGRGMVKDVSRSKKIAHLPPRSRLRPYGIIGLRYPRPLDEVIQLVAEALEREAWVAEMTGKPIPSQTLRDIAEWVKRGCLPK